jgi:hypothetical protein
MYRRGRAPRRGLCWAWGCGATPTLTPTLILTLTLTLNYPLTGVAAPPGEAFVGPGAVELTLLLLVLLLDFD